MTLLKRILRLLRHVLCTLLLLAFLAAWVRGHYRYDFLQTAGMRPQLQINNYVNHIEFVLVWYAPAVSPRWGKADFDSHPKEPVTRDTTWQLEDRLAHAIIDEPSSTFEFLGTRLRNGQRSCSGSEIPGDYSPFYALLLPTWLPAILAAVPLYLAFRNRRKTAAGSALCPQCQYDLRAHKPGDKCPECGTNIPARAEIAT